MRLIMSMQLVRNGLRSDLDSVMELFESAHQKYYRSVGIETYRDDFLQRFYLDHVLRKPDLALILEDLKTEKVVGLLLARKGILQFSPESIGREEFWWIEKPYRTFKNARLMVDSFHNWIRLNECKHSSL